MISDRSREIKRKLVLPPSQTALYPQYNHLNVPTWIIGPALGEGPLIGRPADVLKVWPEREPIQRLSPAQFNPLLDQLVTRHCR
jgi:hypothetical protein